MPDAVAFTCRGSLPGTAALSRGRRLCGRPVPAASLMRVPGMGPARRLAMTKAETGTGSVLEEAARELEAAAHDARVAVDCLALGELDRAHTSALTARVAADAAGTAPHAAPLAGTAAAPSPRPAG